MMDDYDTHMICEMCNGMGTDTTTSTDKCIDCNGTGLDRYSELSHPGGDAPAEKGGKVPITEPIKHGFFSKPIGQQKWVVVGRTYRGQPSNRGIPLNYGQEFQNPAARIFQRGDPMDMAWRMLKHDD